jgi:hypothetical protein
VGSAGEIVAERNRELVNPLQVVDEDERRPDRPQSLVGGLEHTHRLQPRDRLAGSLEQKHAQLASSRRVGECPKQVGSGGERHPSLRLVADDAGHSRE